MKKRGQITWDTLIPWIIALAVLALAFFAYMALHSKGSGAIAYLKQLLGVA